VLSLRSFVLSFSWRRGCHSAISWQASPLLTLDSPTPAIWWQTVEKYGVTVLFSAPTAMRVLRKFDEKYLKEADLSSLKYIFLAGEPLDEPTYSWATRTLGKDIIDHYWQTESGGSPPYSPRLYWRWRESCNTVLVLPFRLGHHHQPGTPRDLFGMGGTPDVICFCSHLFSLPKALPQNPPWVGTAPWSRTRESSANRVRRVS